MPKKIHILEKQLHRILQEYSTPDLVNVSNGQLHWQDTEAYPFIYDTEQQEMYVGERGTKHQELYNDIVAQKCGFIGFNDFINHKDDEIKELFSEYYDVFYFNGSNVEGRLWANSEVIALWQVKLGLPYLNNIIHELSLIFKKPFNNIQIVIEGNVLPYDNVIQYIKNNDIDTTQDENIKQIHLLNGIDKKNQPNMQSYLKDRSEHIGQKLQYKNQKGEMPLAQFKALKSTSENIEKDNVMLGSEDDGNLGFFHIQENSVLPYHNRYDIAVNLIKQGYIIHCTNAQFDKFDSQFIKGGNRALEGYGFYFSNLPYKSIDYGDRFIIVKKDIFNFIDSSAAINTEWLMDIDKRSILNDNLSYYKGCLDNVRTNREYDEINAAIENIEAQQSTFEPFNELYFMLEWAINDGAKTYGSLEKYLRHPQKFLPQLIQLYINKGIDGYHTNGIFTIFNVEKLNQNLIEYSVGNIDENFNGYDTKEDLPNYITLYHGTSIDGLNDILESGVIDAKLSAKRSETRGVNWFSMDPNHKFGECLISITIPKNLFFQQDEPAFTLMNNVHVRTLDTIKIHDFNFNVEKIGGFDFESLNRLLHNSKDDIYIFQQYLMEMYSDRTNAFDFIDTPLMLYILKKIKGEEFLHTEGLVENIQYEVKPIDVDLSSFKERNELNPKLWKNNLLDSKVRLQLLDIADDFFDTLEIGWVDPVDIVLTGSMCNYNWSKYSDIDLHILLDFDKISNNIDLLEDYFNTKKNEWNEKHDTLLIYGYNVELYIENIKEPAVSSGIYSLEKNKWLKKPNINNDNNIDDNRNDLKIPSAHLMTIIDEIYSEYNNSTDKFKLEEINDTLEYIWDFLKKMRKVGLAKDGEQSNLNIIYKILKRNGYINKIWEMKDKIYDKINSIP